MTTITLTATITSNIIKGGGAQIPPSNLTAPLISGSAVVGQTLSVSDGTWAGSPVITFSYQWKRNGSNIGGAIGNTYTLDQADATKVITCEVTATNIAGSASALSSNSLTVLDADANAFITAANITNATQITAINVLTNDLKGYNIWSKMKAIYPFVGGTAFAHKFNLKNPQDTNAAFRLIFNGGWTHTNTGAQPNGINGYADTKFAASSVQNVNSNGLGLYITQNSSSATDSVVMSGQNNINQASSLVVRSNLIDSRLNAATSTTTISGGAGSFDIHKTSSTVTKQYKNSTLLKTYNSGGSLPSVFIYIGTLNNNGTPYVSGYVNCDFRFAYMSDGLSDIEVTNLYIAIETFQTTLGRNLGVPIVSDPDAQAFLFAAQITNTTQANAVNQLVISLKAQGLWSKMKAIYPFVGGTASTHKWNLKDPRDLDAAFRLVFNGGWTHSSTGALPNGTNGYADTFLIPDANMSNNSNSLGYYSGSNLTETSADPVNMGIFITTSIAMTMFKNNTQFGSRLNGNVINFNTNLLTGFFKASKTSSTVTKIFRNGTILNTGNSGGTIPYYKIFIANLNTGISSPYASGYVKNDFRFSFVGDGLTDTDATNLYNTVQTFQTSLSRQV